MASKVGIANIALRMIGGDTITSFTQGSNNANAVQDLYDELRLQMLSYPWNFAATRVKLARSATEPVFEFTYAYVLPSDWIYTVSVHDNDAGVGRVFYKEEQVGDQNVLLASSEDIYLRYTKDDEDVNHMSSEFRRALSLGLARDMAIVVPNSNTLQTNLSAQFNKALARAKSVDAMGSTPERRPRGTWANSRNGRTFIDSISGTS